jgi:hypothetical protein
LAFILDGGCAENTEKGKILSAFGLGSEKLHKARAHASRRTSEGYIMTKLNVFFEADLRIGYSLHQQRTIT